ncbi:hypothetical protein DPEC_G00012160 [Dallia pectoralis]|uniref:Uncharacterized protein n=1 Tax=Dallia pectoralis TaxID=75939 RepID=A0ACC2HLI8_DALPE|nr:hypothetical protein DPEC_G00012160 [Dallia pectoralis]
MSKNAYRPFLQHGGNSRTRVRTDYRASRPAIPGNRVFLCATDKYVMQVLKVCCWTLKIWMIQLGLVVLIIEAQNCSKPAASNMILSDAFINQQTFPDGKRVSFVCSTGYVSAGGSKSITCTAGVWSKVIMKCEKKSCGPPGDIQNGNYDLSEGIEFGATIYATCNIGYTLVGRGDMTCMAQGWGGRTAVCEVVQCQPPPPIPNGERPYPDEETYNYQDVVQYTCKEGFTLNGSSSVSCKENQKFEPSPPTCIEVSCPTPVVENGVRVEGGPPPYKHMSYVTYSCNNGYKMNGDPRLTCTINGWSAGFPTCKEVSCPPPAVVEHGVKVEGGPPPYKHMSSVTYSCNNGYKMNGNSRLTCTINGWSDEFPTCEAIPTTPKPPPTTTTTTTSTPTTTQYTKRPQTKESHGQPAWWTDNASTRNATDTFPRTSDGHQPPKVERSEENCTAG